MSETTCEKPLYAVMAMAFLVLLIAAVNVASLLLVRSAARVREFSLRYALGANARRVVQQLLLEGVLIGVAGGAAGLLIAPVCIRVLVHRLDPDTSTAFSTTLDGRLLAFNFAVALAVSVLFSLAPAIQLLPPGHCEFAEAADINGDRRHAEFSASDRFAAGRAKRSAPGRLRSLCAHDAEPAARRYRLQYLSPDYVSHRSSALRIRHRKRFLYCIRGCWKPWQRSLACRP